MNYDFAPKYWTCPSCKSNNTTKCHHMWSSDLLHFTLYYTLFVPQTSNLFLNISYGSVFLKMCYIMWLWCHRNITHVIKIYRIRKDGGGGGVKQLLKKKNRCHVKISCSAAPLLCIHYQSATAFHFLLFFSCVMLPTTTNQHGRQIYCLLTHASHHPNMQYKWLSR